MSASSTNSDSNQPLALMAWAVYKDPSDYPGKFVVRRFIGMNAKKEPEVVADTLDEARRVIPAGLICVPRLNGDDPVIYEVWI